MMTDTFMIFDHLMHKIRIVSHAHLDLGIERAYAEAVRRIDEIVDRLDRPLTPPSSAGRGASGLSVHI